MSSNSGTTGQSRSTGSRSRSGGGASSSNLESTITRLLVCTKSLLEGLAKWSRGEVNEEEISAIYVKLGNDFNVACAVFARENISMNELLSVPSDLRVCLETCLSDTPSQATLERHLPQVRQIIIGLLHGLREKQRLYRDGVAARRAKESQERNSTSSTSSGGNLTGPVSTGLPLTPNSAGRSKEDLRRFVNQAQQAAPSSTTNPPLPTSTVPTQRYPDRRGASEEFTGGPRPPSNNPRSINSRGGSLRESSRSSRATLDSSYGGFFSAPSSSSSSTVSTSAPSLPPLANLPPLPRTASDASINSVTNTSARPLPEPERTSQRRRSPPPPPRDNEPIPRTPTLEQFPLPFAPPIPPASDKLVPTITARPPSVLDQSSAPEPPQQQITAASLEALKASDNLSRRASKRYSAYAIQKMTSPGGGGGGGSSGPGDSVASSPVSRVTSSRSRNDLTSKVVGSAGVGGAVGAQGGDASTRKRGEHRTHRSIGGGSNGPLPPLPAIPRSFSSQAELSSRAHSPITEEDEYGFASPTPSPALATANTTPNANGPPSFPLPKAPPSAPASSLTRSASTASLPPSESSFITHPLPNNQHDSIISNASTTLNSRAQSPTFPCSIFLQIGRDVKKARHESGPPTIQSLRQLFVEKFQYNPGISGWPEIYLRDPEAGVSYELEEMEEVVPGSVLSLNIDTVEQVKQHIDQGMTSLAQDIKELRSHVFSMRRLSVSANNLSANPALLSPEPPGGTSPSLRPSPSEAQFQDAAQRVLRMKRMGSVASVAPNEEEEAKSTTKEEETKQKKEEEEEKTPTTPVTPSTPTQSTTEIVSTLKSQHAEVQNLRREIGVLRQVYVDFTSQTKEMFSAVRIQNSRVHHLASTKLSTDRAFVEAGTAKLESDSTNLVVKVDELQDTVEQLREDTVKGVRPRPQQLNEMSTQLKKATETREKLVEWLKEVKPSWSQKWSEELSKILGEQKAVETQETLLNELSDDLDDVAGVFTKIQAVAKQLKPTTLTTTNSIGERVAGGGGRNLRELGGGDSQEGLSTVLLEVKALQPDPAKRLEAIAKAERQRELSLQNKTDDFADELGEFVGSGKLKKSGGIEETERLRQARSEATLKAMFS
ncbi:formin-mediated actin nucleation enhancer [Sporobolomyces salmoneus]|uniref:formin-mediated actin nucleation enhancer n=1 Tax=Sporobolomyces salmoneus TaxID=183962 RepID=UPI00317DE1E7